MIARSKVPIQTVSGTGSALSCRKWRNPIRVLVSYRAFSHAWAFRPEMQGGHRITLGADKAYDTADVVAEMRRLGVTELCWNLGDGVIRRRSVLAC